MSTCVAVALSASSRGAARRALRAAPLPSHHRRRRHLSESRPPSWTSERELEFSGRCRCPPSVSLGAQHGHAERAGFRGYDPPPFSAAPSVDGLGEENKNGVSAANGHDVSLNSDGRSPSVEEEELAALEADLCSANSGYPLNPNSPRQVSKAVFGVEGHSTARDALLGVNGHGEEIARLVLRHRELSSKARKRASVSAIFGGGARKAPIISQVAAFSTDVSPSSGDDTKDSNSGDTDASGDHDNDGQSSESVEEESSLSPYERTVRSLFSCSPKSQIDPYWRPALETFSRPAARALVTQLNGEGGCPMGYDPSAGPGLPSGGDGATTKKTAGKKGTLLAYVREQKERYADCVVLMRVGEFYEAFGTDAALLVEHCGLNPMAGKARAGCPLRNVQQTLDCLVNAGLRVAVYEEAGDTDAAGAPSSGGAKSRLKSRMLAQIVTGANPTYLYDLVLGDEFDALGGGGGADDEASVVEFSSAHAVSARPYVGVISTAAGYTLVEVSVEERTARVSERLTSEAVACRLSAYPPAEPLFFVPPPGSEESVPAGGPGRGSRLPFLPSRSDPGTGGGGASNLRVSTVPAALLVAPTPGVTDAERAKRCVVSALLRTSEMVSAFNGEEGSESVSYEDFITVEAIEAGVAGVRTRTNPLYAETATQLGLLSDPTIPPLVSYLLPDSAPAPTRRFLRRWLLVPPPPKAADAMSELVGALKGDEHGGGVALPPLSVPPVGKVLALIRAGQASASVYRDLLWAMEATVTVLEAHHLGRDSNDEDVHVQSHCGGASIVEPLMVLLRHETGLASTPEGVRDRCLEAMRTIEGIVSVPRRNGHSSDNVNGHGGVIPKAFFERNEVSWRGRVRPDAVHEAYNQVLVASETLAEAVAVDFWGAKKPKDSKGLFDEAMEKKSPIVQDIFNNLIALKQIPAWASDSERYHHPRDRNGKLLRNRYTTPLVEAALGEYVEACEGASAAVTRALVELGETLRDGGHLPAIVQAAHSNLILSSSAHHAAKANGLGWNMAQIVDPGAPKGDQAGSRSIDSDAAHLENMWPYWMPSTGAVHNTFTLEGLYLLTAPNMSGKSTLMRSTAAAALLAVCGLAAPVGANSRLRRFDSLFVRGASADVPTEDKSAFGAEMGDVASLLRTCGEQSLVFVDELGRGTSPRDGTALAGAVLEAMLERGLSGMFATHLHGILGLPLTDVAKGRMIKKRMAYRCQNNNVDNNSDSVHGKRQVSRFADVEWTYKLEDGVCTDSLALVTAARFGLPADVLHRAEALSQFLDQSDRISLGTRKSPPQTSGGFGGIDTAERLSAPASTSMQRHEDSVETGLSLIDAVKVVESIAGSGTAGEKPAAMLIPPRWMPPASLEGCSCVYVIEVGNDVTRSEEGNDTHGQAESGFSSASRQHRRYYVGETDALSKRLRQHRAKGPKWADGAAAAIRVSTGGKSAARNVESLVIQKMAQMGFDMISVADGRKIRSTPNTSSVGDT